MMAKIETLAAQTGTAQARLELTPYDTTAILDLARAAAEQSGDRTNVPVLCYLLGFCAGNSGTDLHNLIATLQ